MPLRQNRSRRHQTSNSPQKRGHHFELLGQQFTTSATGRSFTRDPYRSPANISHVGRAFLFRAGLFC